MYFPQINTNKSYVINFTNIMPYTFVYRTANISALSKQRESADISAVWYTNLNGIVNFAFQYLHVPLFFFHLTGQFHFLPQIRKSYTTASFIKPYRDPVTNALVLGKVLWNGRYKQAKKIYSIVDMNHMVYVSHKPEVAISDDKVFKVGFTKQHVFRKPIKSF